MTTFTPNPPMTPENTIHIDTTSGMVCAMLDGKRETLSEDFDGDADRAQALAHEKGCAYILIKIVPGDDDVAEDEEEEESESENE